MKIVIMGAGAIGSLYGGLIEKKFPGSVVLVGRKSHVDAIKEKGLQVRGVLGDFDVKVDAREDPSSISHADIVFITTKTYDSISAALRIKHLVDAGAFVIAVQNGLGTELEVAEALNTTRVLRATTCMGALTTKHGEVTVTGDGITEIGSHYPENEGLVEQVCKLLEQAGFYVRPSNNIKGVVWTKTVVNCGINPVGALTGLTNGEIHNSPELRKLVIKLVKETAAVADALGVELTTDDPIRYALGTAKATSENTNSMLQDLRCRKRTEIDYITGAVIKLAHELGLETTTSESVYALVKAIESRYLESGETGDEATFLRPEELLSTVDPS
jgi:2-dehydropantoate 2-reductase